MTRILQHLRRRRATRYGRWVLYALLACACFYTTQMSAPTPGPRTGDWVTVLSGLPAWVLNARPLFWGLLLVFYASAAGWVLHRALPWTSWTAAATFTVLGALHHEQQPYVGHTMQATAAVLWFYALWYHDDAHTLARRQSSDDARLFPQWVHTATLAYLGIFYGFAGWNKLATSGLDWINGVSLQLWVHAFGQSGRPAELVLEHRRLALLLAALTLAAEALAPLAVFVKPLRWPVGLALLGFHAGQQLVFGWAFHANAVLLAVTFLPVLDWVDD